MEYTSNHYWNNFVQYGCIFNCGYKVILMTKYIPNLYWNNSHVSIRLYLNSGYKKGNWEEKIATASMQRILYVQQTDPLLLTSYLAVPVRRGVVDVDGVNFLVVVRRKIDLAKTFTFSPLQSMTLNINCLDHLSISVTQFEYIVFWGFVCLFGCLFVCLFCFTLFVCFLFLFCTFGFFSLSSYMFLACKAFDMRVHLIFSSSIRLYRKRTERASLSVHVTNKYTNPFKKLNTTFFLFFKILSCAFRVFKDTKRFHRSYFKHVNL